MIANHYENGTRVLESIKRKADKITKEMEKKKGKRKALPFVQFIHLPNKASGGSTSHLAGTVLDTGTQRSRTE